MLRSLAVLMLSFCLLSCGSSQRASTPVSAYKQWGDKWKAVTGGLFGHPCMREVKQDGIWDGKILESLPMDTCYRFEQPKRFRGLWRNEFEGSQFCPGSARACDFDHYHAGRGNIWLDVEKVDPSLIKEDREGIYQIDFIGRKTMFKGTYGHGGIFDEYVIADKVIALKKVPELKAK